jgi:hypothetical protein
MGFMEEFARGERGVRGELPPSFEPIDRSENGATLVDQGRGLSLHLSSCPYRLDLTPAHEALLRQDIERHARDLFVQFAHMRSRPAPSPGTALRTDDPAWSPVVEVSPRTVAGAQSLEVIHRISYEPGSELVMGHLLLPVASGLFEFRVVGTERTATGLREATVVERMLASLGPSVDGGNPLEMIRGRVGQRDFDDPALDAQFLDHPLSVVRAALRWLREEAGLVVTAPAPPVTPGEVSLTELGAAFSAPPRYLPHEVRRGRAQFARVSFATTDGVALLTVIPVHGLTHARTVAELRELGEMVGGQAVPAGATEVAVSSREARGVEGRASAEIHVRFTRDDALPACTAIRAFVDERGEPWLVMLGTSQSIPEAELFPQLEAVARSFRRLGEPGRDPARRRPWWKFR